MSCTYTLTFAQLAPGGAVGAHLGGDVETHEVALVDELGGVLKQLEGLHALDLAEARGLEEVAQDAEVKAHLREMSAREKRRVREWDEKRRKRRKRRKRGNGAGLGTYQVNIKLDAPCGNRTRHSARRTSSW